MIDALTVPPGAPASTSEVSERIARHVRAAELYFVSRDMTAAALDASTDMPPWTPAIEIPAPIGLIAWAGDLPAMPVDRWRANKIYRDRPPSLRGMLWAQYGGVLHVHLLARADEMITAVGMPQFTAAIGPGEVLYPIDDVTPFPMTEIIDKDATGNAAGPIQLLGATWVLMQQPTMSSPRQVTGAGGGAASHRQLPRRVTIIDLRPMQYVREDHDPGHPGRVHTHRWVVRGHWRDQAHGPGRSQRKRIWVPSYIKGPEGAPLLARERVNVWRR